MDIKYLQGLFSNTKTINFKIKTKSFTCKETE